MARSAVQGVSPGRGLLVPHGYLHPDKSDHSEVQSPSIIAGASLCFKGGSPADLKNMADRQEWKGQSLKQKTCKKAFIIKNCFTQYIFQVFFKEMIRIDLFNMENVKYMAKFVLSVLHVFDFVV